MLPIDKARGRKLLAWLWVLCLGGTAFGALAGLGLSRLEFANQAVASGLHWGVWLLAWPAARHFGWGPKLPLLLWAGLGLSLGLSTVLTMLGPLGAPGWVFGHYAHEFFLGSNRTEGSWKTDFVYFRRGPELLVSQRRNTWDLRQKNQEWRCVQLTPLTPLLRWVTVVAPAAPGDAPLRPGEAPPPGYAQWTPVQKPAAEFSLDDDEQRQLNALKAAEQRCQAEQVRVDSLLQLGQLRLTLPAATRRGANTFGCRFQGEVWRDFLPVFEAGQCRQRGAMGTVDVDRTKRGRRFTLQLSAFVRAAGKLRSFYLNLPELRGPGVYELGPDTTSPHTAFGPHMVLWRHKTGPAADDTSYVSTELRRVRVTITRFDTVARVVAGTFEGYLYNRRHGRPEALPLRDGRFDVRYYPGPGLRRR